jgi:2-polyprenyl-3-methyl-5-hydroxy-6-metoxy-1,4-benzoquinol methylase
MLRAARSLWNAAGYALDRALKTGGRRHEFEHKYARFGDCFGYHTDPYEQAKYAVTLDRILAWRRGSARLLEVGCSVGAFTALAAPHFDAVTATDLADEALRLGRAHVGHSGKVTYVRADLLQLDLGERFDVILCAEVLMYVREAAGPQVCAVLDRHLAPGGLVIEVTNADREAGRPKFFHAWDRVLTPHFAIVHRERVDDPARPYEIVAYGRRG